MWPATTTSTAPLISAASSRTSPCGGGPAVPPAWARITIASTPCPRSSATYLFTVSEMSKKRNGAAVSGMSPFGVLRVVTPTKPILTPSRSKTA